MNLREAIDMLNERPEEFAVTEGSQWDILVVKIIFGFREEIITPEWYHGREVHLFYDDVNFPGLIQYSWDSNSCNAQMYRNGKDDSQGIADPLPWYTNTTSDGHQFFLPIVERMAKLDYLLRFYACPNPRGKDGIIYDAEFLKRGTGVSNVWSQRHIGQADVANHALIQAALRALSSDK